MCTIPSSRAIAFFPVLEIQRKDKSSTMRESKLDKLLDSHLGFHIPRQFLPCIFVAILPEMLHLAS